MNRLRMIVLVVSALAVALPAHAQWPKRLNPGVPMKDGKPDLNAPAPRAADGHVDLSGVWEPGGGGTAGALPAAPAGGRGGGPAPAAPGQAAGPAAPRGGNPFGNIGISQPGGQAPYQPWAADLVKKRMADNSKDNPDAHCLPMGIMQLTSHPYPKKIVQTKDLVLIIYEGSGTTVREIFLDRPVPNAEDVEPWWNGYSAGRWEGDTLVVDTVGFMNDGWLDVRGSPITNKGKITERYSRPAAGRLQIDVTIDDPTAYTKPFNATVNNRLVTDQQLIEFVCLDKDAVHYVGADGQK